MIRFEIDTQGLRFEIQWQLFIAAIRGLCTLLRQLKPIGALIAAVAALHAAPEMVRLLQLLGWL